MTIRAVNVRHKGQMTLPADVRRELGVIDGGRLLLERRGREWVLIRSDDLVARTAGVFAKYVKDGPVEWDREEIWTEIATERWDRLKRQLEDEAGDADDRH
jgi:AbrB family looped-hinge helix DNA binding protein